MAEVNKKPPIECCGSFECKQLLGGQVCCGPAGGAKPNEPCHGSINGGAFAPMQIGDPRASKPS
eukprot:1508574-Prorocentrum_lima.AAC.1